MPQDNINDATTSGQATAVPMPDDVFGSVAAAPTDPASTGQAEPQAAAEQSDGIDPFNIDLNTLASPATPEAKASETLSNNDFADDEPKAEEPVVTEAVEPEVAADPVELEVPEEPITPAEAPEVKDDTESDFDFSPSQSEPAEAEGDDMDDLVSRYMAAKDEYHSSVKNAEDTYKSAKAEAKSIFEDKRSRLQKAITSEVERVKQLRSELGKKERALNDALESLKKTA